MTTKKQPRNTKGQFDGNNTIKQDELSPGYKTKPFAHIPSHTTTANPVGGIGSIKMNNYPIKKRKGRDGQDIIEISREKW